MFRYLTALALVTLTALVLTHSSPPAYATTDWEQVGVDIDGEAAGDESGYSVALNDDGTILAVGEWKNTGPLGAFQGQVRVYELSGESWVQKGADINGEADGDYFGMAVDLSEDGLTLAVGAPFNGGAGTTTGSVRVFTFATNSWNQLGGDLDAVAANDQFGESVALSADGRTVAIGAPFSETTGNANSGVVAVFTYSGVWGEVGTRGQIEGESGDNVGENNSIDISDDGTIVAIGARYRDNGGLTNVGALEVYALTGGAWVQRGATEFGGLSAEDRLGYSVSLNGDGTVAAAGAAYANPESRSKAGSVRVLEWDSTSWIQRGDDIPGGDMNEQFGYSVSLDDSGDRVVASSPFNGNIADNAGRARVFDYSAGQWTQVGSDVEGEAADDNLGVAVAMSGDGTTFAVGAHRDDGAGTDAGTVRVFTLPAESVSGEEAAAGTPGIYLHVAGPVGRLAEGSPVYYGSDRVAITSTYLLTITNQATNTTSRVLAEGVVDARGNLEARALLPALQPGDYDVVFQGKHRGGAGLRLSARIAVGDAGQIMTLGPNIPTVW